MSLVRIKQRQVVVWLCALATLTSCSTQSQLEAPQSEEPPPVKNTKRPSATQDASISDDASDAAASDADTRISTHERERDPVDAGETSESEPAEAERDASEPDAPDEEPRDAGSSPAEAEPAEPAPEKSKQERKPEVNAECTRVRLREKADAYLQSLRTADTSQVRIHPAFRYTENARDEALGAGAWLRRAESLYSRHVVDESRCSSFTQAVMSGVTGRFSFGVRLRYSDGLLLEAEAQVVPEALAATDLDRLIPMGEDAFIAEVPEEQRGSRAELFDFAQRYFDSVIGISRLPPSAPECRRLQNGFPLGDGTCRTPPGSERFEQQRFDVVDEPVGIVAATVLYDGHIGVYLIKIADDMLQNIHVIGGAASQSTGW